MNFDLDSSDSESPAKQDMELGELETFNTKDQTEKDIVSEMIFQEVLHSAFGPNGVFSAIDRINPPTYGIEVRETEEEEMPSFLLKKIDSTIQAVDDYTLELFLKIKEDKDEFLDSLATPLNRDPLEILKHL